MVFPRNKMSPIVRMCASRPALTFALLLTAACAMQSHAPKPLAVAPMVEDLRTRSLDDPRLRDFMALHGLPQSAWPRAAWGLPELTLAAFYFHPDLDVARAQWALARAGEKSAAARPNVGLEVLTELIRPAHDKSPWALGFVFDFPFVTRGKQSIRVAQAQALLEAARLEVGTVSWSVRSRLRERFVDFHASARETAALDAQLAARNEVLRLTEKRKAAGLASQTEVATARLSALEAEQRAASSRARTELARPALAQALGLTAERVTSLKIDTAALDLAAPSIGEVRPLEDAALANRIDLRRALAEYRAAEEGLRLEIAKQYPDLSFKPGYTRDQGDNRLGIGLGLTLPIPHANEGPIGEALARRELEAKRAVALAARALGEVSQAHAAYRAALRGQVQARELVAKLQERARSMEKQFSRGAIDRLELAQSRLELEAVRASEQAQGIAVQRALGALEEALQRPLDGSGELGVPYEDARGLAARKTP
jgi:outer membrane protein, heavy metal efflux system